MLSTKAPPSPPKAPIPEADRAAALAELDEVRKQFAAAKALEDADADRGGRAPELENAAFKTAQKRPRYIVQMLTPIPNGQGSIPAMAGENLEWTDHGIWLRVAGRSGGIFVPYSTIGCIDEE
jgi:hypothetical protein